MLRRANTIGKHIQRASEDLLRDRVMVSGAAPPDEMDQPLPTQPRPGAPKPS